MQRRRSTNYKLEIVYLPAGLAVGTFTGIPIAAN